VIHRRLVGAFALGLFATAALAACGDGDDAAPAGPGATPTPAEVTELATATTVPRTTGALNTPATATSRATPATSDPDGPDRVLVFSKTAGFRHDSIEVATQTITALGAQHGFEVVATEDAATFAPEGLAAFDAVVFLMTTGDVLDAAQQSAMEGFVSAGGGFVGIHSAADTEYDWPWYGQLVGAYFDSHPAIQPATVTIADPAHPSTAALPSPWAATDEWYNFRTNVRGAARVLLTLDEASYTGGSMGADHPIAWCRDVGQGRSWYTGLGHTREQWATPELQQHVLGGLLAVIGRLPSNCAP
jgi:type 1 glutamine amidotransferase